MATNEPVEDQTINEISDETHDSNTKPIADIEQENKQIKNILANNDDDSQNCKETGETDTITSSPSAVTQTDKTSTSKPTPKEASKEPLDNDAGKHVDEDDEDLEEGELKDDDDDDDDEDDDDDDNLVDNNSSQDNKRVPGYNNNINNDDNNNSGFSKDSSYHEHNQHQHRRYSPDNQHQADMQQGQYPLNHHHFNSNSNNNHYRYQPHDGPPPLPMNHPMAGGPPGPPGMYPRGGPGGVGPMHKVNVRCRFYSKTSNKCTWGDHCRFEHRDDSPPPGAEFGDNRMPPQAMGGRGPPVGGPMGPADRGAPYPPYIPRGHHHHQPYPGPPGPPPPHGYNPYDQHHYGHHHSTPPPLPPHSMPHWRQQHSPYPSPSSTGGHPPESVSPALLPTPGSGPPGASGPRGTPVPAQLPSSGLPPVGGAPSPGYPSPSSSSSVVYERKHRLAYELAPWNDRGGYPPGPAPPVRYVDRGPDPAGYPGPPGRGFYRNHHYSREPPYGREPPTHMGGAHPGYSSYPSAYSRGGPMAPHASHYNKYMGSSQRNMPPDSRRSRSTKRGHDEDESSWSDSGSEDSILGHSNYSSSKSHANKVSKLQQPNPQQQQSAAPTPTTDQNKTIGGDPVDQGSGTPPGEPLVEDKERQEILLNKLKEIEDLMAKKKSEQDDPM